MEVKAVGRYIRVSPQKARLVVDLIRGKDVDEAITILSLCKKRVAPVVLKLLRSAVANAENTGAVDVDSLYVKKAYVDQGPTWRRLFPRAMGRVNIMRRKTSHITIILDER